MSTFGDLIEALLVMDRQDAVEALGQLYDTNIQGFKEKVDEGREENTTALLLDATLYWTETPQGHEYWSQIFGDLQEAE